MKPVVRSKVANGLVICLLVPRVADTVAEVLDNRSDLSRFTADDSIESLAAYSDVAVARVRVEADDPSGGGDPSGGDPTGCEPPGDDPTGSDLVVNGPVQLVTAEDGSTDIFEVSMEPDPASTRYYRLQSSKPGEALPDPRVVEFGEDACFPQTIRVVGQNDGDVDPSGGGDPSGGDPSGTPFTIRILDESDAIVATVPGINFDNDNYVGAAVEVLGPSSMPNGSSTVFSVFVKNLVGDADGPTSTLFVEPSPGFELTGFAASLLNRGGELNAKGKFEDGTLILKKVELPAGNTMLVAVNATLVDGAAADQKITARFVRDSGGMESDDDQKVRTSVP